jgi:hypothetical protein
MGSMLVRAATTLFWVEAEEVRVVAATPVRTRTATKARTKNFMIEAPFLLVVTGKLFVYIVFWT